MKKLRTLCVLIILCFIIFGAYVIIPRLSDKGDGSAEKDAYLYVDQNDVSHITAFSFVGGESELSFKKENGVWVYQKNKTLPINAVILESALDSLDVILATKIVSESGDDLAQYGLESPLYTLTIETSHGKKCYLFGDLIESKGLRYMMEEDAHTVYLTEDDIVEAFSLEVSDCLASDTLTLPEKEDVAFVTTKCGEFSRTERGEENVALTDALSSLSLERWVDFGSDKFDIFGLADDEYILVTVESSDGNITKIRFGLGETEEFIYALVENESGVFSEMIYLIESENKDCLNSHLRAALESRGTIGE